MEAGALVARGRRHVPAAGGFQPDLLQPAAPGGSRPRWLERGPEAFGLGIAISLMTWPLSGPSSSPMASCTLSARRCLLAPASCSSAFRPAAGPCFFGRPVLANLPRGHRVAPAPGPPAAGLRFGGLLSPLPLAGRGPPGRGLGRLYLASRERGLPALPPPPWARPAVFLGRHSLIVYILHQPVIIAILLLLGVRFF